MRKLVPSFSAKSRCILCHGRVGHSMDVAEGQVPSSVLLDRLHTTVLSAQCLHPRPAIRAPGQSLHSTHPWVSLYRSSSGLSLYGRGMTTPLPHSRQPVSADGSVQRTKYPWLETVVPYANRPTSHDKVIYARQSGVSVGQIGKCPYHPLVAHECTQHAPRTHPHPACLDLVLLYLHVVVWRGSQHFRVPSP